MMGCQIHASATYDHLPFPCPNSPTPNSALFEYSLPYKPILLISWEELHTTAQC